MFSSECLRLVPGVLVTERFQEFPAGPVVRTWHFQGKKIPETYPDQLKLESAVGQIQ